MILFLYGFLVGVQNVLATCECAYQHNQRAFRCVEVREHLVYALELVPRIHEDMCRARTAFYKSVFIARTFQGTHARCSYGKNWTAVAFGLIDFFGNIKRNYIG